MRPWPPISPTVRCPGVSIGIADRAGPVLVRTAGYRGLAARRPVDDATVFEIGSIGKSFAAVVILQLADEGRLALDDPVERHLPWFRVPRTGKRITIHHLLSHTAGVTAGMEGTPEAVVQVWQLRHVRPGSSPGRHFHYSNVGYKTVGAGHRSDRRPAVRGGHPGPAARAESGSRRPRRRSPTTCGRAWPSATGRRATTGPSHPATP